MFTDVFEITPKDEETLDELENRIVERMEYFCEQHGDFSATIVKKIEDNCLEVRTLRLREAVN